MDEIFITKPFLPPLEELNPYLRDIWNTKILTNNGKYNQLLEQKLQDYLTVPYVSVFNNATTALIVALKACDIKGSVITTPYSFVATTNALIWAGINPIFVDIDPNTFNLDPNKIKAALLADTKAILGMHCYGIPCDVDSIKQIADENNLKVIYDAAHAFSVQCHCGSLLNHGDLSVLSFHATKVFNTLEGGAIISHTEAMKRKIDSLRNFGFFVEENNIEVTDIGINGKMNEIQAAIGLLQLNYVDAIIDERKDQSSKLKSLVACKYGLIYPSAIDLIAKYNYAYFPIVVTENYPLTRDALFLKLKENKINARRYFYPIIPEFKAFKNLFHLSGDSNLGVSKMLSEQILCLPIYPGLNIDNLIESLDILL